MTEIKFRSDMTVKLLDYMGGDQSVVAAARVSTAGEDSQKYLTADPKEQAGLINFLMKNRHGTPFEHNSLKFYVEAPIFVFREWHRHRIGFSYNEMSGRYKELAPTFWLPSEERPLSQQGKPGHYTFVKGTPEQYKILKSDFEETYRNAYHNYEEMLSHGIAKEVARSILPVGLYSAMYCTTNARSLMHFLSLRTKDEKSKFPSYPQAEIEDCARLMEEQFAKLFPITYRCFVENGRVAP